MSMRCAGCDAELTASVFPGGVVVCASCGRETHAAAAAPHIAVASPYRAADDRPTLEPPDMTCPFCGGMCRPEAAACPHCEVRLSRVRCPTCFALQTTGKRACDRCGHALKLEPLLDPSGAPCPRCDQRLSALGQGGMHECAACGGLFVDHPSLARIVEDREQGGSLPVKNARPFESAVHARDVRVDTNVRYLKCAQCHQPMNRVNFGRKSGVVVDVCKMHGTWFDAGELTQAVEWVTSGGLELARKSVAPKPEDGRVSAAQAEMQVAMMNESMRETRDLGRRLALTEGLVDAAIRTLLDW